MGDKALLRETVDQTFRDMAAKGEPLLFLLEPGCVMRVDRRVCAMAAEMETKAGDLEQARRWRRATGKGRPAKHFEHYVTESLFDVYKFAHEGKNFGRPAGRGSRFEDFVKDFWNTFFRITHCPVRAFCKSTMFVSRRSENGLLQSEGR
jgi:hypothetical protein